MKSFNQLVSIGFVALGLLNTAAHATTQSFNTSGTTGAPHWHKTNYWTVTLPAVTSIVTTCTLTASGGVSGGTTFSVSPSGGGNIGHFGSAPATPGTQTISATSGAQTARTWNIAHSFGGSNVGTLTGNITTTFTW